ncbi:MAG: nitrate reductase [Planctomycetes bacterium]|nr:nitrate reductase [Planctomycetota bacterium]
MLENADPSLINDDIRPTTEKERHWSVLNMASLWVGMVVCVPTYMLAGGLVDQGMNWKQAVLTVMLGNVIILVPMILNGHAGTKYGVPFPVLARASFGIHGAHIPALLRALVACGWFGIQTWFGGSAIYQLLNVLTDGGLVGDALPVLGVNAGQFVCFLGFWAIQVWIIFRGIQSIRILETLAAPFLLVMGLALLWWAYAKADGFGPMLSAKGQFDEGMPREGEFMSAFLPGVTAMVGFWATLALNIPDFTRYARLQRDQILGQAIGLPATMTLFAFIGVAVTSATMVIFTDGKAVPDPTVLAGKMGGGFSVVASLFALSIATLSTNLAANVVSPANAMINAAPGRITYKIGGLITALIGLLIFPWKLIETSGGYIFTWLIGYSALLGPIVAILIVDYFLVRRMKIDIDDLFSKRGRYWYRGGFNPAAIIAFVVGVLPNVPGFIRKATGTDDGNEFDQIYTYAWFVGFFLAGTLYWLLMSLQRSRGASS